MTADRDDFIALMKRANRGVAVKQPPVDLRAIQQAAVQAEYLTGSEYWDIFLRYIQSAVDRSKGIENQLMETLASAQMVEHTQWLKTKIALLECRARVEAWESVMQLPKDLIDNGGRADELLVGKSDEAA